MSWFMPASKLKGSTARMRSLSVMPRYVETMELPAITLAWLNITPLGFPVEPEVYRMAAKSLEMLGSVQASGKASFENSSKEKIGTVDDAELVSPTTIRNSRAGICASTG